jgi:hypothetical protein
LTSRVALRFSAERDAEGNDALGALRDHQCDQEMLVRKEKANAIAKKFGRAVQRVRVPSTKA